MNQKRYSSMILFLLFVLVISQTSSISYPLQTSQTDTPLNHSVSINSWESTTLASAFREALVSAGVPGGIIVTRGCEDPARFGLEQETSSLRTTLDSLKSKAPGYDWKIQEGIIEMYPGGNTPELLALSLPSFSTEQEITIDQALNLLLGLPQVREKQDLLNAQFKTELGLTALKRPGSLDSADIEKKIRISLTNCRVIDVLNAIVRTHGRAIWSYEEFQCSGRKLIRINFIAK